MKNSNLLDQFFLNDQGVIQRLVQSADLKKTDVVLEIGAGHGEITREIAKKVKKVIAVEIDENFKSDLNDLPKNVEVIFGNGLDLLKKGKLKFQKIVASLPSSIVEPLMKFLLKEKFLSASLIVPLKFVRKLKKPPFCDYWKVELLEKVDKKVFAPSPKTNWALIVIKPVLEGDISQIISRYFYHHPNSKIKNALREAIINVGSSRGKTITKNQSREIIEKIGLSNEELEKKITGDTLQFATIISKIEKAI